MDDVGTMWVTALQYRRLDLMVEEMRAILDLMTSLQNLNLLAEELSTES